MTEDRIPPQNLEAEAALLGCLMIRRDLIHSIRVEASDFYAHVHEKIFKAIASVAGGPTDKIAIAEALGRSGALETVGGISYLSHLIDSVVTASSGPYYAALVREKSVLRSIIAAGSKLESIGFDGETDVDAAVAEMNAHVARVTRMAARAGTRTLRELMVGQPDKAEKMLWTYTTPWPDVDLLVGKFVAGDLVAWAAEPGAGKSIAVNQLALWTAEKYGAVAMFPSEMGADSTTQRLVATLSGVSVRAQRDGMTNLQFDKVKAARERLARLPIHMADSNPLPSTADVVANCRALHDKEPLAGIFVDHVGFLADVMGIGKYGTRQSSKHERQSEALMALLALGKELKIAVHVVFHFSRAPAGSKPTPDKTRLRDGGNAEGHCSVIIFPHRGDDKKPDEFIIDKARDGNAGKVEMRFDGASGLWLQANQDAAWFVPQTPYQASLT